MANVQTTLVQKFVSSTAASATLAIAAQNTALAAIVPANNSPLVVQFGGVTVEAAGTITAWNFVQYQIPLA
jgi:hypothetical protein